VQAKAHQVLEADAVDSAPILHQHSQALLDAHDAGRVDAFAQGRGRPHAIGREGRGVSGNASKRSVAKEGHTKPARL
jgi:hypothetical protein